MRNLLWGLVLVAGNASASVVSWECGASLTGSHPHEAILSMPWTEHVAGPVCNKSVSRGGYTYFSGNDMQGWVTTTYSSSLVENIDSFTLTTNLYGSARASHTRQLNAQLSGLGWASYSISAWDSLIVDEAYDYSIDGVFAGTLLPNVQYDWSAVLADSLNVIAPAGKTVEEVRSSSLTRTISAVRVPEPGTAAMLVMGLLGICAAARRSKRVGLKVEPLLA
jgi:hypothetical protein